MVIIFIKDFKLSKINRCFCHHFILYKKKKNYYLLYKPEYCFNLLLEIRLKAEESPET